MPESIRFMESERAAATALIFDERTKTTTFAKYLSLLRVWSMYGSVVVSVIAGSFSVKSASCTPCFLRKDVIMPLFFSMSCRRRERSLPLTVKVTGHTAISASTSISARPRTDTVLWSALRVLIPNAIESPDKTIPIASTAALTIKNLLFSIQL